MRQKPRHYTGIGSRDTPPDILAKMTTIAVLLDKLGYILRSGGAPGADTAFERGSTRSEIFLPWRGFNGNKSPLYGVSHEALVMASDLHPAWDILKPAVRNLMARNCNQVLGDDLNTPTEFVLCWTPDGCETKKDRTSKTGGTGLAIALANSRNIPVVNMKNPNVGRRLKELYENYSTPTADEIPY